MRSLITTTAALAASITLVAAQTWSDCDPTKKTDCPSKPGLNQATEFVTDFSQGASAATHWTTTSNAIAYDGANGANFQINKVGEGPTIASDFYIFFGKVEVTMKCAPGAGVVSSVVLQSDDLDEIDWEWIGSDAAQGQTNYFGKGNTTTYDRGQFHPITTPQSSFHTYAVDWKPDVTTWSVDGKVVRTLNFADAVGGKNYPQTPMNVRLGNWVAGTPGNSPGTIEWAGGLTDFSKGPFSMYVQTVKVTNYNPSASYKYSDMSGDFQSIQKDSKPAQESALPTKSSVSSSAATGGAAATGSAIAIPSGGLAGNKGPSDNVPFQNSTASLSGSTLSNAGSLGSGSSGSGVGSGFPSGSSSVPGYGSAYGSAGSGSSGLAGTIYSTTTLITTSCSCTKTGAATNIPGAPAPPNTLTFATNGVAVNATAPSYTLPTGAATPSGAKPSAVTSSPVQFTGAASKLNMQKEGGAMAVLLGALVWVVV